MKIALNRGEACNVMQSVLNLAEFNTEVGKHNSQALPAFRKRSSVLSKIADEPIALHGAGRTDAGVHATNMVAHLTRTLFVQKRMVKRSK
jgi:tRNA pseudouridine38-40 synthase